MFYIKKRVEITLFLMLYYVLGGMMDNIYLIASSSYHKTEEAIKTILNKQKPTIYDLNNASLEDILEDASYISLFNEQRYIVVKNADIFGPPKKTKKENNEDGGVKKSKKESTSVSPYAKLIAYLENPNPDTILIFSTHASVSVRNELAKMIKEKGHFIDIETPKPKEIKESVDKIIKKAGYKADYITVNYLISTCQNNYDLVVNELEKIFLYYLKPCTINLNDLKNILSHNIEDNNFKFIDCTMRKELENSFRIYDDLMLQKVEPIILLSMLAKEIRNTLLIKKMFDRYSKKEMMEKLNIKYEFQLDKIINHSYNYKERELENKLVLLCDLDFKIKSGKINSKKALELFILNMCN